MPRRAQSASRSTLSGDAPRRACSFCSTSVPVARSADASARSSAPAHGDGAAVGHDAAQRVVEGAAVVRALADLHVGQQVEERAAPVGPAPAPRAVQPAVARAREPLGQAGHETGPGVFRRDLPGARARDRLEVRRQPLLQPALRPRQVGKPEVRHLVRENPIALEVVLGGLGAEPDHDRRSAVAERRAEADRPPAARQHQHGHARERERAVHAGDRPRGALGPGHDRRAWPATAARARRLPRSRRRPRAAWSFRTARNRSRAPSAGPRASLRGALPTSTARRRSRRPGPWASGRGNGSGPRRAAAPGARATTTAARARRPCGTARVRGRAGPGRRPPGARDSAGGRGAPRSPASGACRRGSGRRSTRGRRRARRRPGTDRARPR